MSDVPSLPKSTIVQKVPDISLSPINVSLNNLQAQSQCVEGKDALRYAWEEIQQQTRGKNIYAEFLKRFEKWKGASCFTGDMKSGGVARAIEILGKYGKHSDSAANALRAILTSGAMLATPLATPPDQDYDETPNAEDMCPSEPGPIENASAPLVMAQDILLLLILLLRGDTPTTVWNFISKRNEKSLKQHQ